MGKSVKRKKTPGMEREEKEEKSEGAEGGRKILPYAPPRHTANQGAPRPYSLVLPGRRCRVLPIGNLCAQMTKLLTGGPWRENDSSLLVFGLFLLFRFILCFSLFLFSPPFLRHQNTPVQPCSPEQRRLDVLRIPQARVSPHPRGNLLFPCPEYPNRHPVPCRKFPPDGVSRIPCILHWNILSIISR